MRARSIPLFAMLFLFLLTPLKSLADWAYPFVVWNGYIYVVSEEKVEKVDKEIGHVTKYSDREGTYSGNFSNVFKKGTKYYSIKGISTDEAIAVQDGKGKFVKATREGKYEGDKKSSEINFIKWAAVFLVIIIIIATGGNFVKRKKER
ncbi:hypothetical protein NSQ59_01770 [Margalitia sp. FSL K6-0131]|uniref:hypothetical protein n=1 Tax=Margalitia sp. FSL K6-0131 TaxID=2954604 RepID=UPI0030F60435